MPSRTRERTLADTNDFVDISSNYWPNKTSGPHQVSYEHEAITDVVTPNYKELVAAGVIVNNPCTYDHLERETVPDFVRSDDIWGGWVTWEGPIVQDWAGSYSYTTLQTLISSSDMIVPAIHDAKSYALAQMDNTPYAFGEDIGEIGQTIKFLKNPVTSLVDIGRSMRKSFEKRKLLTSDHAKAWSDAWLQYRFALSPLVRSGHDAIARLTDGAFAKGRTKRKTARGFVGDNSETAETQTVHYNIYNGQLQLTLDRTDQVDTDVHAYIMYKVSNPGNPFLRSVGLRFKDIPTTMWQLMPYSFVVDRAFNISNFCKGFINLADPTIKIEAAGVVTRVEQTRSTSIADLVDLAGNQVFSFSSGSYQEKDFRYGRETWSPSVKDTVPSVKPIELVNTATKIVDDLSLFIQLITR